MQLTPVRCREIIFLCFVEDAAEIFLIHTAVLVVHVYKPRESHTHMQTLGCLHHVGNVTQLTDRVHHMHRINLHTNESLL